MALAMHPESIAGENKYWRSFWSRSTSDDHATIVHTGKLLSVIFFIITIFIDRPDDIW